MKKLKNKYDIILFVSVLIVYIYNTYLQIAGDVNTIAGGVLMTAVFILFLSALFAIYWIIGVMLYVAVKYVGLLAPIILLGSYIFYLLGDPLPEFLNNNQYMVIGGCWCIFSIINLMIDVLHGDFVLNTIFSDK